MKQKGFTPLLIILLVVILGVVGYFGYKNYQLKTQAPSVSTTNPTPIDMSNWKTYNDTTFGFNLSYPDNWRYFVIRKELDCCGQVVFLPNESSNSLYNGNLSLNVAETMGIVKINLEKITINNFKLDDWVDEQICFQKTECNSSQAVDTKIDGIQAKKIDSVGSFASENIVLVKNYTGSLPSGSYVVTIALRTDKQSLDLFPDAKSELVYQQILSTFKFTN